MSTDPSLLDDVASLKAELAELRETLSRPPVTPSPTYETWECPQCGASSSFTANKHGRKTRDRTYKAHLRTHVPKPVIVPRERVKVPRPVSEDPREAELRYFDRLMRQTPRGPKET